MTDVSNVVPYYPPLMYRPGMQQTPPVEHTVSPSISPNQIPAGDLPASHAHQFTAMAAAAAMHQSQQQPQHQQPPQQQQHNLQQHSQQQHHQSAHQHQQHFGVPESQQCAWYSYGHAHSVAAAAAHHQHQQNVAAAAAAQQYLEHEMPLWTAHGMAHPYLQYQQHQAFQQQQQQAQAQQQQQHQMQMSATAGQIDWSGDEAAPGNNNSGPVARPGDPSPALTGESDEISNPATPGTPPISNNNNNVTVLNNNAVGQPAQRTGQNRSPFEWMKKTQYQPNPACNITNATAATSAPALHDLCTLDALGKTRTKDKYRVVYSEHQRLELEKEFYSSKYITIRRKAELATSLALSERQVKIWFQNRRAKDRKQSKKRSEMEQQAMVAHQQQQQQQQQPQQRDVKPIVDMHGLAHHQSHAAAAAVAAAAAASHVPPIASMANLSLGGMNAMLGGLVPGTSGPSLMSHHHHHHHHQAAAAAAAHHALLTASAAGHPHQAHSVLGM